jgi:hypothetical protein
MIRLKVCLLIQAHDAQHGGHRAFADGTYGAKQQYLDGLENPLGKQRGEC